jgi:flagellar biosynthetic protein FliP
VSTSGVVGLLSAFAFVLGLLLLALKLLRRFAPGTGTAAGRVPMTVLRRLPLGPRQGIAVVQLDSRVLAVSVGDGGVRLLTELDPALLQAPATGPVATSAAGVTGAYTAPVLGGTASPARRDFRDVLRQVARGAGFALLLMLAAAAAQAQQAPTRGTATGAPAAAPATAARPNATARAASAGTTGARIDSLLPRLAPQMQLQVGQQGEGLRLSGTVGIVVMMGLLTLLPMLVLLMTGFTRILIVMHFLKQAIGAQSAPPAQLVAGLSLLLTLFVMGPTLDEVNRTALTPWMDGQIEQGEMLRTAAQPFRAFMFSQVRDADVETFLELSGREAVAGPDEVPLIVLTSAFVTSELRTAFQIGFALFLPFIVIDIVVASVLMSVGMMMVPPAMIALPFKLLLFVLVDGWSLVIQGLVRSFA